MQRRPLQPIPIESQFFESYIAILFAQMVDWVESEKPKIEDALFKFDNFSEVITWLGLQKDVIQYKWGKRQETQPKQAIDDHPTGFLQWGAKIESRSHVFFEIGDHAWIVRFDFKINQNDQNPFAFVQLDQLRIWDGGNGFDINCSDHHNRSFISGFRDIIFQTVMHLDAREVTRAKDAFHELSPLIQQLYERKQSPRHETQNNLRVLK